MRKSKQFFQRKAKRLLMRLRAALTHPFGLALVLLSAVLAVAMLALPQLELWSQRAVWVLVWGLVAYAATVAVLRMRRDPPAPELRKLQAIRKAMAARLEERRASGVLHNSEITRLLSEAIAQMDQQLIPAMRKLLERQQAIQRDLARYESGDLPVPDAAVLQRLRAIHSRQRVAIDECLRHAANADATLVALLQDADDSSAAIRARAWADDLLAIYDTIARVLRPETETEPATNGHAASAGGSAPVPDTAPAIDEEAGLGAPEEVVRSAEEIIRRPHETLDIRDLTRCVEEALRRLNDLGALARCDLVTKIPRTLASVHAGSGGSETGMTPLSQAQALREALVLAIERLKPAGGTSSNGGTESLGYYVIYEEYVLGKSPRQIIIKYSIGERTLYRRRSEAIETLAHELARQEEILSRSDQVVRPD